MKTFNTQVCTTNEQSKRLLELGLKKETADMVYCVELHKNGWKRSYAAYILEGDLGVDEIPAWSLNRLIAMCPNCIDTNPCLHKTILDTSIHYCEENNNSEYEVFFSEQMNLYDNIIDCIEWLINEGHFYKDYLNE